MRGHYKLESDSLVPITASSWSLAMLLKSVPSLRPRESATLDLQTLALRISHLSSSSKRRDQQKMSERIDLLNHTAADIQRLIDSGSLSTVELVKKCLEQIERHNYNGANLRAVIDAAPLDSCVKQAEKLDHERITKGLRSPMHGIPVLVKVKEASILNNFFFLFHGMICLSKSFEQDNFATDPALGMGTTCGTLALRGARPRGNAVVIDKVTFRPRHIAVC